MTRKEVASVTTIRATCPTCGEVELTPEQIRLTVIRSDETPVGPESHYTFECPTCLDDIDKPADERIARLLSTGGVAVTVVDGPSELLPVHPEEPNAGPALTYDDLLDFHLLLDGDGWFEELLTLVP